MPKGSLAVILLSHPTTGIAGCCALADNDHADALPSNVMKSRRRIASPQVREGHSSGSDRYPESDLTGSSANVRFGSEADIGARSHHVCFTPESGHWNSVVECPLCANRRHGGRRQFHATSSFIAPTILTASGSARPRAVTSRRGKPLISTPAVVATISDTMSAIGGKADMTRTCTNVCF